MAAAWREIDQDIDTPRVLCQWCVTKVLVLICLPYGICDFVTRFAISNLFPK